MPIIMLALSSNFYSLHLYFSLSVRDRYVETRHQSIYSDREYNNLFF